MCKVGRALRADSLANFSGILAWAEISVRSLSRNFAAILDEFQPSLTEKINSGYIHTNPDTFGSIQVSGKLPTYPSPNPTFSFKCCVSVDVDLGSVSQKPKLIHF